MDRYGIVLWVFAATSGLNALWMLLAPAHWYSEIPAEVPDFGPLNVHFVRDIGVAYATQGVALAWAALRPAVRGPCVALAALFAVGHAATHVLDLAQGAVGAEHWLVDLPGVFLPALVLGWLALRFLRR
jgi:hypothetical protein